MNQLTDEQLIDRMQHGQRVAFDELYKRYTRKLYVYCLNSISSHHPKDAEDLVQDVFIRVIKSANTFDPSKACFRTWLYRIARNRCIDFTRRESRRLIAFFGRGNNPKSPETDINPEDQIQASGDSVEETVIKASTLEAIRDCIQQLKNEDEKQAFLFYYLGGKVYREIAEILGKSLSTARNRVQAAQLKVKHCLERKGIQPDTAL